MTLIGSYGNRLYGCELDYIESYNNGDEPFLMPHLFQQCLNIFKIGSMDESHS
jgi:hypothetical protein